jgi:hypothetical protein
MNSQKIIATFNDPEKAHAVKTHLERAGIHAEVVDESKVQKFIFMSKPLACDKVVVAEADFDKATAALREADAQSHILSSEVRCLQCSSPNVEYPQFTRNTLLPTSIGVLLACLHLIRKAFYCRDCHYTWAITESLRPRNDVLNWPSERRGLVKQERG